VIVKMNVTKAMISMPSATPAGDDRPQPKQSGLTWEPVISMGMRATMATMWMPMRWKKFRKPMMDQCRMWRTEGMVVESVKIGQYISDLKNTIMAKQMQRQAMYLKCRLYCKT